MAPNNSPILTDFSHELLCHILQYLPLKKVLSISMLCKKLQYAVDMHLRLCKEIDLCEGKIYDYMPSTITDDHMHALLKKCPHLEAVYGLHPLKVERRRLRKRSALTVPGIIEALCLCCNLKSVETSDLRLLEAIMHHLPQVDIIGHFQNRDSVFPPHASQRLKLLPYPRISSLHLIGVEVPELTAMPHLHHLHLQCVRFTKLQPFRAFLAQNLKTFVMKHCMGPSLSLRYLSLIIALSSSPSLSRLELVRVPLPGGLFQRAVEDSYRHSGFVNLKTLVISGCKGVLESDLGHLMIVSSKNLESISIQPSLTRDSLFVSLSFANCMFPQLKSLHLGYVDKLNAPGEWTNDTLLSIGLAEVPDTPSSLTDSGMKVISQLFPNIKSMSVSNCPHLMAMDQWSAIDGEQQVWKELSDLTLQRCHCLQLPSFALFLAFLPKIEVVILNDMFREPPKGCSHVGLSAGTGLGMSSAVVSNQDEHIAVQGHHQEFELHPDDHPENEAMEDEFIEVDNMENPDQHIMVLQQEFFDEENQIARVAQREDILPVGNVPENQIRRELNADYRAASEGSEWSDVSPMSTSDDEKKPGRKRNRGGYCRRRKKPKRSLEHRTSSDDEALPKSQKVVPKKKKKKPKLNDQDGICLSDTQPCARDGGMVKKECYHEKKCQKNCSKGFDPNKPSTSKDGNCLGCRCSEMELPFSSEPKVIKRGRVLSSSDSEPIRKKSNLDGETKVPEHCADQFEKDTNEKRNSSLTRDLSEMSCTQEPESLRQSVIENTEMLPERCTDENNKNCCSRLTKDYSELLNIGPEPKPLNQCDVEEQVDDVMHNDSKVENSISSLTTNTSEMLNYLAPEAECMNQSVVENTKNLSENEIGTDKKREMSNSYPQESVSSNQYGIKYSEKKDDENVEKDKCDPITKDPTQLLNSHAQVPESLKSDVGLFEDKEKLVEKKEVFCSPEDPNELLISNIQNPKSSYQFNAEHSMKMSVENHTDEKCENYSNPQTRDQRGVFSFGSQESESLNLFNTEPSDKKSNTDSLANQNDRSSKVKQTISDVDMIVDAGINFPGKIKSEPPQNSTMIIEENQVSSNEYVDCVEIEQSTDYVPSSSHQDILVVPNETPKCDTSNDLNINCDLSFEPVLASQKKPPESLENDFIQCKDTNIKSGTPTEMEVIPLQVELAGDNSNNFQNCCIVESESGPSALPGDPYGFNSGNEPSSLQNDESIPTCGFDENYQIPGYFPPECSGEGEASKELSKQDPEGSDIETDQNDLIGLCKLALVARSTPRLSVPETIVVQDDLMEDYKPNDHNYCSLNVDIKSEPESVPSPSPPVQPDLDETRPHHSRDSELNEGFLGTVRIKSEPESLPPSPRGEVEEAALSQQDNLALNAEVKSECESAEDVPQENNGELPTRRQNHTRIIDCHCCFEIKSECESGGESCHDNSTPRSNAVKLSQEPVASDVASRIKSESQSGNDKRTARKRNPPRICKRASRALSKKQKRRMGRAGYNLVSQGTQATSADIRRSLRRLRTCVKKDSTGNTTTTTTTTTYTRSSKVSSRQVIKRKTPPKQNVVTHNKSTSTSDPLMEDDAVQTLRLVSETLISLTIISCGISDVVIDHCHSLTHVEVQACRILKMFQLHYCPALKRIGISQCPKLMLESITPEVVSLVATRKMIIYYEPCMQKYSSPRCEKAVFSKTPLDQGIILFQDYTSVNSESQQAAFKEYLFKWMEVIQKLYYTPLLSKMKRKKTKSKELKSKFPYGHNLIRLHGVYTLPHSIDPTNTTWRYQILTNDHVFASALEKVPWDKGFPPPDIAEDYREDSALLSMIETELHERNLKTQKKLTTFYIPTYENTDSDL